MIGDGIVTGSVGVGWNRYHVFVRGCRQRGDGGFIVDQTGPKHPVHRISCAPDSYGHGVIPCFGVNVLAREQVVVIVPANGGFTVCRHEINGQDDRGLDGGRLLDDWIVHVGFVHDEFTSLCAVAKHGGDGVIERTVHTRRNREGNGMGIVGASPAIERVARYVGEVQVTSINDGERSQPPHIA